MKTIRIPICLTAGLFITAAFAADDKPSGTLQISGDTQYGSSPTLTWTLDKPQVASEVLEFQDLDKSSSTLIVKQNSNLKITIIGSDSQSGKSDPRRVSAIRTRNGAGKSFQIFEGSFNNFLQGSGSYYAVQPRHELSWKSSAPYYWGANIDWYTNNTWYKLNGTWYQSDKRTYEAVNSITVPVEAGDSVDFLNQFWTSNYRHCYSGFGAYDYRDTGNGSDPGQKNLMSLFDGDPIPSFDAVGGGLSTADYLRPYSSTDGKTISLAPNQMINLIENLPKYQKDRRGRISLSSGYDVNDFIFMVEVEGAKTFVNNNSYKYFLVKYDRTEPKPQYDEEGNAIPLLDKDGNPIVIAGDDEHNYYDQFQEVYGLSGTYDEIHEIQDGETSYQFTTPNGRYGSEYQLIYMQIAGPGGGGGGGEETNSSEEVIASVFLDSYGITFSLVVSGLPDEYPFQMRMMGDSKDSSLQVGNQENGTITFNTVKNLTYSTRRKITNLLPPPPANATAEDLSTTPKGSYSLSFEHRKYTYAENSTSFDEGILEVLTGDSDDPSFVYTGDLPTEEISNNGTVTKSDVEQVIAKTANNTNDKNGEEQLKTFAYLAIWSLDATNTPYISGYQKVLIDKQTIQVWAAPTAKITVLDQPADNTYRRLPKFQYSISNIYPKAETKVIFRPKNNSPAEGVLIGAKYLNGQDVAKLTFEDEYLSPADDADFLNNTEDGEMTIEIVHLVDYDGDGDYDDVRVLDSFDWTLKRDIIIKGGINLSE